MDYLNIENRINNLKINYLPNIESFTKILFFFFIGILIKSLIEINSYGSIIVDETAQLSRTLNTIVEAIRSITNNDQLLSTTEAWEGFDPYGIITKIPATIVSFIFWYLKDSSLNITNFPELFYYKISHIFSVIYCLATCWLLLDISKKLNFKNKWIAPLFLISSPVFTGHSLMNIKDIPYAFFYTFFTWICIKLFKSRECDFSIFYLLPLCLISGALISLKITAFPAYIFEILITLILINLKFKKNCQNSKFYNKLITQTLLFFLFTFLVIFILLPTSWNNPLEYFPKAFSNFADMGEWCMHFNGICEFPANRWLKFLYLIRWLKSKLSILSLITLFLSILFFSSSIYNLKNLKTYSLKSYARLMFGFQLFLIPVSSILYNSVLYDGIRQVLFILPALAFFANDSYEILEKLVSNKNMIFMVLFIFLLFSMNFLDITSLAPYQYTFFNQFSRANIIKGGTDLDYWGLSIGEIYKESKDKLSIFPDESGAVYIFRRANNISIPNKNDKFIISSRFRPPINKSDVPFGCSEKTIVKRNYFTTNDVVKISSLISCPLDNK